MINRNNLSMISLTLAFLALNFQDARAMGSPPIPSDQDLPKCESIASKASPGDRCITSIGFVFERVFMPGFGTAWRDSDGYVWSEAIKVGGFYAGVETCSRLKASMPSRLDFENGESQHLYEVMPFFRGEKYWTSTKAVAYSRGEYGNANFTLEFPDSDLSIICRKHEPAPRKKPIALPNLTNILACPNWNPTAPAEKKCEIPLVEETFVTIEGAFTLARSQCEQIVLNLKEHEGKEINPGSLFCLSSFEEHKNGKKYFPVLWVYYTLALGRH